jgi:formylglycine-generating enzyme
MSTRTVPAPAFMAGLCLVGITFSTLSAAIVPSPDSFGTPGNQFNIDFAFVGNAGNGSDAGAGGGSYSSPYGSVSYNYRIGLTEVSQDWITKATNSGMTNVSAGAWTGSQPAANMTWYEAAAFVNWLNTSTGHQAAYDLTWTGSAWTMNLWNSTEAWQAGGQNLYRHKDAYYFLPSEDEWYKAAYHKNDGATANYWDYATGSNTAPAAVVSGTLSGTAVYDAASVTPVAVNNNGGTSPYGTIGQNGNVFEWAESAFTSPNDSTGEPRVFRGGDWESGEQGLRSSERFFSDPSSEFDSVGFRVASIPEPTAAMLMIGSGLVWIGRRRRPFAH